MSTPFARVRVNFEPKKRSIYTNHKITPDPKERHSSAAYNSTRSVRSRLITDSSTSTNNDVYSITTNSSQREYTINPNQEQTIMPDSNKNNKKKKIEDFRRSSCKQKIMLVLVILFNLLKIFIFVLPYILIYLLSQKVTPLTQVTETYISQSSNHKYHCGSISSWTLWQQLIPYNKSITMNIDTSSCKFNSTPLYFTSVGGLGNQFGLTSYTAIYGATNASFTIFANNLYGWDTTTMLTLANSGQWDVNWLGIIY